MKTLALLALCALAVYITLVVVASEHDREAEYQ